ncbi:MAG TPA: DUF3592 domain-containing protein [Candidatus Hydrogenedentes bacterium]|jgi:hypothetical protein|nr:DUF3592 domain-containing protein [Candidatus Hydrogenedentota bacterium]HPJ98044.1 DUF3592 domain-containing protein [Candidatus Hydrogenedentota bacterium]
MGFSIGPMKSGVGCLILFALPFIGVALFMGYLAATTVMAWHDMRHWEEVPAFILEARLETSHDSDGSTYRATARYRYTYGGQEYTSERVAIATTSDNLGSFQQNIWRELAQYEGSETPFRCYVNPQKPSEAVLYRQLRPEMLLLYSVFVLMFGGAGVGMIAAALHGHRRLRNEHRVRKLHPEQPWQWNNAWATGTITSSNKTVALFALLFAGFWNLVSLVLTVLVVPESLRNGETAALLVLIFPAAGLVLAVWAAVSFLRWRKYGDSLFEMSAVPGIVGGPLSGIIRAQARLQPDDGVNLTLNCIRRWTTGAGKNRSTEEKILWQDVCTVPRNQITRDMAETVIPVHFAIPFDAEQTSDSTSGDRILWRLEASAATPGVDYRAQFEVPVFRTPESRSDYATGEAFIESGHDAFDLEREVRAAGIVRTPKPSGGLRYNLTLARLKGAAAFLTVFFVLWAGICVVLAVLGAPVLMTAIFCIIELALGVATFSLWFGSQELDVDFQVLTATSRFPGFARRKTFYYAEIEAITTCFGMQSGNRVYFNVEVKTSDGRVCPVAKYLPSRRLADAVAADLERALSGQG